jgi:hypothetical protein
MLMLVVVAATTNAHADCKLAAVTQGDPELVQTLIARLAASGIATTSTTGCPVVQVRLERRGQQLHLRVTDAFNRIGERDVQDVATAAAIIESWTYQEVEAGTLPAEVTATTVSVIEPPHLVRDGIAASVMSAVGSDRTAWVGGALSACVRLGPTCAGAALRAETDTRETGTTAISQNSYELSAIATIDLPQRLGSYVVSPGIGVGYGWMHVTTHHHDAMNNLLDVPSSDHQLRTGAHVALLDPLGDHVSVFGDLWGDVALARSDSQFGPGGSLRLLVGIRLEAP